MENSSLSCWIVVNGYLQQEKFSALALFVQKSAEQKGINATIIRNDELISILQGGKASITHAKFPSFVLFLDKDIHLARQLELLNIPVYNRSEAIEICDSKAKTHQALANHNIPMPKTIFPPFTYEGIERTNWTAFQEIGRILGFPLIVKEAYGSFGQQVYFIHSETELITLVKQLGHKPFIIQEFIEYSRGRDVRINVVGNRVIASMLRTSEHDFRANMTNGGKSVPYTPTEEEANLAIRAAQLLQLDFAGVDLLFGEDGPLLCEVNSNSHLLNIYHCTGINIADAMFDYMIQRTLNQ